MKTKITFLVLSVLALVFMSSCTKRCRCTKFNLENVYYSKEEVKATGKSCSDMRFLDGLHTPYYTYCEWTYTE